MKSITYLFLLFLSTSTILFGQTIYVSPTGDDSNSGTSESPVKSFQRGADLAKAHGASTVQFDAGEYVFTSTVILDATYSGITFQGSVGTVFTSLVQVTGWTAHNNNIMVADVPSGIGRVRYLHDASENWLKVSSTEFFRPDIQLSQGGSELVHWEPDWQDEKLFTKYPSSFTMPDPSKASQYDLRAHMVAWHAQVMPITAIDASSRRIDIGTPCHYPLVNGVDDLLTEIWILNTLEGIDEDGEWANLDGKIYLRPKSGTDDIYVPMLEELIRIDAGGDGNTWTGTPVTNVHFKGITFTGTDYRISITEDRMAQHDWQMVDVPEGMLRFRNTENCSVTNCTFTKGGSDAVRFDRWSQNNLVDGNTFSWLGKGMVFFGGRAPTFGDVNKNNTITNNKFSYPARIKWDAAAVHLDQTTTTTIKQNFFEEVPLSAVIINGGRNSNALERQNEATINRDMHFMDYPESFIDNPDAIHWYDYENRVEENTFRAVHIGVPEQIPAVSQSAPGFTNGLIYNTGRTTGGKDYFNKNYFYDADATTAFAHTWVMLGDGFADSAQFNQNVTYNLNQINPYEEIPWISNNCDVVTNDGQSIPGECLANANIKLNCPGFIKMECDECRGVNYAGNIDFDFGTPSGDAAFLNDYIAIYQRLCAGGLPTPPGVSNSTQLPGAAEVQAKLAEKIVAFGGTVPSCSNTNKAPQITGQASNLSTLINTPITISLSDLVVSDPDNTYPDDFTLTVENGTNYTVSGTTVTPSTDFVGALSVPVIVNDGVNNSNQFSLSVSVVASNEAPVITGQATTLSTNKNTPITISLMDLTVTDSDNTYPDDFTLTLESGTNYTVSESTVTPVTDFVGTLSVPVMVNDGINNSNQFTMSIDVVEAANTAPVITGQASDLSTNVNTPITISLTDLEVTDPDNTYPDDFMLIVESGSNYTVSGAVVTPDTDFVGELSVLVKVNDGTDDSNVFSLSIDVTGSANAAPLIVDQLTELITEVNTPITINLSDLEVTDEDNTYPDDFTLIVQNGMNYTVSQTTVTPDQDYSGLLIVPVMVNDGVDNSNVFELEIEVEEGEKVLGLPDDKGLSIYPNPSTDHLVIKMDYDYLGTIVLNMYNMSGELIKRLVTNKNSSETEFTLNVENFPRGVLFIELSFHGMKEVRRVILE